MIRYCNINAAPITAELDYSSFKKATFLASSQSLSLHICACVEGRSEGWGGASLSIPFSALLGSPGLSSGPPGGWCLTSPQGSKCSAPLGTSLPVPPCRGPEPEDGSSPRLYGPMERTWLWSWTPLHLNFNAAPCICVVSGKTLSLLIC